MMKSKAFEVSTAKILPLPFLQAFCVNAISKFQQISTSALTEQCHEKYELVGKKNNANYIDLARFIAIYAVVLGHFHPFVGMDNIVGRKLIYMFHMPIFFIISGMLSKPTTIKKAAYSLVIPYLIYNIISIARLDIIPLLTIDALQLANSPTWFFMALFVIKVVADHINKYIPFIVSAIVIALVLIHVFGGTLPREFCTNAIIYGLLFFLIGKYIKDKICPCAQSKWKYAIYFITIGCCLYSLFAYDRFDMYLANTYNPIIYFLTSLSCSISVLLLCHSAFNLVPSKWHCFIKTNSRGSMLIVGTHYIVLAVIRRMLPDDFYIPFLIKLLVTAISTIPYYYIIKLTFNNIPILYGKKAAKKN